MHAGHRERARYVSSADVEDENDPIADEQTRDAERRSLAARNAMIGQPVTSFDELFGLCSIEQIEQLARDRTAESAVYTLSPSRPFPERLP